MKLSIHAMHHHVTRTRTTPCTTRLKGIRQAPLQYWVNWGTCHLAPHATISCSLPRTHSHNLPHSRPARHARLHSWARCIRATTHTCHHRSAAFPLPTLPPLRNLENPKSGVSNLISQPHPPNHPRTSIIRYCLGIRTLARGPPFSPFPLS